MRGLILVALTFACGARTELDGIIATEDASPNLCLGPLPSTAIHTPVGAACAFGSDSAPSLVVVDGTLLLGIDKFQTLSTLFTFLANAPGYLPGTAYVASRGKYAAAMLSAFSQAQPNQKEHFEVVVIDVTTSQVLAHDEFDGAENGGFTTPEAIYGNDEGTFVYGYASADNGVALGIISSTGKTLRPVNGIVPMGDPSDDHIIPVYKQNDSGSMGDVYWFDPCTGVTTASHEHSVMASDGAYRVGSRIVYLDFATQTLFDEGPHDVKQLTVSDLGNVLNVQQVHPSGWTLMSVVDGYHFIAANVALGEKHAMSLMTLPQGYSLLDPLDGGINPTGVRITSLGNLVVPLRNADHGMLFESAQPAATWSPLGVPIGQVYSATPFELNGTYLMYGTWEPVTMNWPPPQNNRVDGTGTQLCRPDESIALVVENVGPSFGLTQNYAVSGDGGCVAYFDDTLHLLGAVTGAKVTINLPVGLPPGGTFASSWVGSGGDVDFFGTP